MLKKHKLIKTAGGMMKDEHKEQLNKFDETEQELERAINAVREQRREYINLHDLNKVDDEQAN